MSEEQFVIEIQKRWNLFFKFHPKKAKVAAKRLSSSSPLFLARNKKGFEKAIEELLEAENNPQIFEFIERDWRKARDLMNLALASR